MSCASWNCTGSANRPSHGTQPKRNEVKSAPGAKATPTKLICAEHPSNRSASGVAQKKSPAPGARICPAAALPADPTMAGASKTPTMRKVAACAPLPTMTSSPRSTPSRSAAAAVATTSSASLEAGSIQRPRKRSNGGSADTVAIHMGSGSGRPGPRPPPKSSPPIPERGPKPPAPPRRPRPGPVPAPEGNAEGSKASPPDWADRTEMRCSHMGSAAATAGSVRNCTRTSGSTATSAAEAIGPTDSANRPSVLFAYSSNVRISAS